MKNRNISLKQALIIVPLVFIGIIVVGGTIAELGGSGDAPKAAPVVTQAAAFDVPSLIGMDVDGVKTVLGTPTDDTEPTAEQMVDTTEWWKEFERDGQTLLVTYDPRTRAIVDFFISTNDPSGATRDTQSLLSTGNLSESDSRYSVEFVRALNDRSVYTGVKIVSR